MIIYDKKEKISHIFFPLYKPVPFTRQLLQNDYETAPSLHFL